MTTQKNAKNAKKKQIFLESHKKPQKATLLEQQMPILSHFHIASHLEQENLITGTILELGGGGGGGGGRKHVPDTLAHALPTKKKNNNALLLFCIRSPHPRKYFYWHKKSQPGDPVAYIKYWVWMSRGDNCINIPSKVNRN